MHPRARVRVGALRRLRHGAGLSFRALAEQTELDAAHYWRAEAGQQGLSLTSALVLARRYGVHVEDIVELVDENGYPLGPYRSASVMGASSAGVRS